MIFGLWINAYCFRVTVTLTYGFSSRKIVSRAYLLYQSRNPKFGMWMHLGRRSVRVCLHVTVYLTSDLNSRKNRNKWSALRSQMCHTLDPICHVIVTDLVCIPRLIFCQINVSCNILTSAMLLCCLQIVIETLVMSRNLQIAIFRAPHIITEPSFLYDVGLITNIKRESTNENFSYQKPKIVDRKKTILCTLCTLLIRFGNRCMMGAKWLSG